MSGEELKPCPHCGSDEVSMSFSATLQSPEPAARFVECENCAAMGPSFQINDGDDEAAQALAVACWNQRAHPLPEQPQEGEHIADAGKMVATHPNTDQGMTAGSIGEQAAAIRVALYRAVPNMPSYPVGIVEPVLEQFRLSSTAALEAEVERWHDAYCIAHDQAMSNGEAYQDAAAQIASLKQRLESAEGLLKTAYDAGIYLEPVAKGIATFLQEQEKQNG